MKYIGADPVQAIERLFLAVEVELAHEGLQAVGQGGRGRGSQVGQQGRVSHVHVLLGSRVPHQNLKCKLK